MKRVIEFLKTTASGGLFVLLPVILLYLLLAEALELVLALAAPIADLFPKGIFDQAYFPVLIALILIMGASFLIGLAMHSAHGRRLGGWVEQNLLGRLPTYNVLKSLTTGFAGTKESKTFQPAVLTSPDGSREIAYEIEDHGNGLVTLFLPWSPTAFAGFVKIVERDRIERLDVTLGDVTRVLGQWGVGTRDLLGQSDVGNDGKD